MTLRVAEPAASERFYDVVLAAAGIGSETTGAHVEWEDFSLAPATAERPATAGLHVAFSVASRAAVDAFWRAGTAAGFPDDGPPGPRPQYSPTYHGAFLRDPDGNSVEAVHRDGRRTDGNVDHLWLRVGDLAASARFYAAVAPHAGFAPDVDTSGRASFTATRPGGGTFSLVAGGPATRNVHIAFGAPDDATVRAFHAAALVAGARGDGEPGERPEDPVGSYGASVLDPSGHTVAAVCHHR